MPIITEDEFHTQIGVLIGETCQTRQDPTRRKAGSHGDAQEATQLTSPSNGVICLFEGGDDPRFGQAVGVEGLTTVVGVPLYGPSSPDGIPNGQGQVAVFTADAATGEVWTRTGTIANPNPQVSNFFGQMLALKQDRLVVGTTYQLYVFDKHGSDGHRVPSAPTITAQVRSYCRLKSCNIF